jgi:hypothetical protein
MRDLARLPDIEWCIHALLQQVGVTVLHGAPGTLKSFLALHIAGCIAYGLPFVPDAPKCRRGLVLYVAYEGLVAFKHRRRAWLRLQGLPEPDHDALKLVNPRKQKLEGIDGTDFDLSDGSKVRNLIASGKRLSEKEKFAGGGSGDRRAEGSVARWCGKRQDLHAGGKLRADDCRRVKVSGPHPAS